MTVAASRTVAPGPLAIVARLAVLLEAGLGPAAAWEHLADAGCSTADRAARAAAEGDDVAVVLRAEGGVWRDVAAVWSVAVAVGAPLADTLRDVGTALRDAGDVRDDVAVALAEPLATARLLTWLPMLGIPLGMVLGVDVIGLIAQPLGMACVGSGVALVLLARWWSARLAHRARPAGPVPGLAAELFAVALSGGVSIDRASTLVRSALDSDPDPFAEVADTIRLCERAGVPARDLLRGEAWIARRQARTEGRTAAARLSTRLLVPLGVCTLPAFLLLAVVPMVLGIVRAGVLPR